MNFHLLMAILFLCIQVLSGCSPIIIAGGVAGAGATIASDRRSPDKILEDQAIEIQATDYIYSHKEFGKNIHISVTSFNGSVLLVGEIMSEQSKQTIMKKINRMRGVKKVIDAIDVKKPSTISNRTNDTWITSKVKSHIIARKGLITRTKVVTSMSNVYLMGIVSNEEAKQITKIVKGVNGVKKVYPLFESRDGTLEKHLSASANLKPGSKERKPMSEVDNTPSKPQIEEEDVFTVQPYVLQPAVRMTSDE